jgi:hypothetical protein
MAAYASDGVYDAAARFESALRKNAIETAVVLRQVERASDRSGIRSLEQSSARLDGLADQMARRVSDDLHHLAPDDPGRVGT